MAPRPNNNRNNNRRAPRKQITPEERRQNILDAWAPKTDLGRRVVLGEITKLTEILDGKIKLLEPEIVDSLVPGLQSDLLMVGQSKGKFGGGAGRVFKQTQKKTREGNKPSFSCCAVVGNRDGFIGVGVGKAKETVPAREKSTRAAKLNIIAIPRGSGDWESDSEQPHTIPYKTVGKCGSIEVTLLPAPIGTGLVCEKECRKILELAGIKNVWAKTRGHTASKLNLLMACFDALQNLTKVNIREKDFERLHITVGPSKESSVADMKMQSEELDVAAAGAETSTKTTETTEASS